ncbi:hypothetical protein DFH09DRAFT_1357992 [Mycena vulgaris]|nr:hypothetical protein DFH09DRAFT_1357992 [Mycena vulgaris]
MKFGAAFALLSSFVSTALAVSFIVPGAVWSDTSGAKILAHGGHVIKVGSTFYWASLRGQSYVFRRQRHLFAARAVIRSGIASKTISGMYRPKFVSSGKWWASIEGPGLFKASGVYYLIVSSKTGYRPDPNKSYWATSLADPWTGATDIAPENVNTYYNSQSSAELVIKGTSTTSYIFLGDARDAKGADASSCKWLPISMKTSTHTLMLQNHRCGHLHRLREHHIYAADGIVGGSVVVEKRTVHNTTLPVRTSLDEATTHVSINSGPTINLSELNSHAGHDSTVPVALSLKGGANTLTFGATAADGQGTISWDTWKVSKVHTY